MHRLTNSEVLLGIVILISGIAALAIAYHRHMKAMYAEIAKEDAKRMADMMFEQMKNGMKVRVVQRLQIVDEMERRKQHESRDEEVSA